MTEYKIAAAYVRVSDERQDEYSPESQTRRIREYADKNGYVIPDEYVYYDDGISGRSTRKRGSFQRMITAATSKSHPFDAIFVWRFSRFARNQEDSIIYKSMLSKRGVEVISVSEPIPDNSFGSLIERFIEWSDEYYSSNLSQEVKRGFAEKHRRAEPTQRPPFGYIMGDCKYMPDEESGAADVIREIFTRFAAGEGMRTIAVELGNRGVLTLYGCKPDNRWIEYVINNPTYIGKLRFCSTRAISRRHYDDESITLIDGPHEPLIPMELWERAQERYKAQIERYGRYANKEDVVQHMLKGIVHCSSCGATLVTSGIKNKAGIPSLQCHNYARGSCHVSHSIVLTKLEDAVKAALAFAVENNVFTIHPEEAEKRLAAQTDVEQYKRMLAAEERRLLRAKQAYLAEIDTLEQYKQNKTEIEAKISEIKARMTAESHIEVNTAAIAQKVTATLDIINNPTITPQAKNEALRAILTHIIYDKANQNVALYFRI